MWERNGFVICGPVALILLRKKAHGVLFGRSIRSDVTPPAEAVRLLESAAHSGSASCAVRRTCTWSLPQEHRISLVVQSCTNVFVC